MCTAPPAGAPLANIVPVLFVWRSSGAATVTFGPRNRRMEGDVWASAGAGWVGWVMTTENWRQIVLESSQVKVKVFASDGKLSY